MHDCLNQFFYKNLLPPDNVRALGFVKKDHYLVKYINKRISKKYTLRILMTNKSKESASLNIEQYQQLIEHSPVAIGIIQNKKVVFLNMAGAKLFGNVSPEQLAEKSLLDYIHPDYTKVTSDKLQKVLSGKVKSETFDTQLLINESNIDIEITASDFSYEKEPAIQFTFHKISRRKKVEEEIQNAKDDLGASVEERTSELKIANENLKEEINERKNAVEALQKSENKYRSLSQQFNTLLNGIPDNLILLAPDLKIMWANKAAARAFGKDFSELKGDFCYSLCCNIISPCENCPTSKSFLSGKEESSEILTSDGKVWDIRAFPIKDEAGNVKSVIELAGDITERMNLRASTTRNKHLASLGELAAGVAHEINNPINNIINYAQLLIDDDEKNKRDDDVSRRIIRDGERIATIVRSLLSFAKFRKEDKIDISLADIFSDTLSLTSAQIRKDAIDLRIIIPDEPIYISAHSQLIQQVFLNIISNSRYALNQKYPESDSKKILEIECKSTSTNSKPFVEVIFYDHGTGIPHDILDKILDPFFSTKPNQVGTGLGLSISHGIITEHGGKLIIESTEGEFTKTTIYLPESIPKNE